MPIYDANGNQLYHAYDADGNELNYAYDAEGNVIYRKEAITLKVMQYNVGQWYTGDGDNVPANKDAEYYALHNGMIQNADADILFINEYWNNISKLPRTALSMLEQYYPYIHAEDGASGYYGRAICSKYPLSNWTHHTYTNESTRYYDSAEITVNGVPITLVITHLSTDQAKRMVQIPELITYLNSLDRFIAGGDYNTGVKPNIDDQRYETNVVPFIEAGFNMANFMVNGQLVTCIDGDGQDYCIDNIVASSNITFTDAYVDTTKTTDQINDKVDHMPLIAEIEL